MLSFKKTKTKKTHSLWYFLIKCDHSARKVQYIRIEWLSKVDNLLEQRGTTIYEGGPLFMKGDHYL